ncbi:hypothetical protein [Pseudoalteromonas sp. SaAl2]
MKKLISVLGVISLVMSLKLQANEYHYDNYSVDAEHTKVPRTFYFNLNDTYILDPTNEYKEFKRCLSKYFSFCIDSEGFNFAVKTSDLKEGCEWSFNGNKFAVDRLVSLDLFGFSQSVYLINLKPNDYQKYQFYYSKNNGLLAFSITSLEEKLTELYFLRESKGLGSKD